MSPNIGTLRNGVQIPKLLNSPFASWSLINLDFLLPQLRILIISLPYQQHHSKFLELCFLYLFYILNNMISFLYVAKQLLSVRHVLTYLHVLLIILLHLNITHKILNSFSLQPLTLYVALQLVSLVHTYYYLML